MSSKLSWCVILLCGAHACSVSVLLSGCGLPPLPSAPPPKRVPKAAPEADRLEADLAAFGHAQLPHVESALEDISQELGKRSESLHALDRELVRLGKSRTQDETYVRWERTVSALERNVAELKAQRREAYLAYRKFQLSHGGEEHHKRQFEQANNAAATSQKVYTDSLREFEGR